MKRLFGLLIISSFMFIGCDTEVCANDLWTGEDYCVINGTGACHVRADTNEGETHFCYNEPSDAEIVCTGLTTTLTAQGVSWSTDYDAWGGCAPSASEPCEFMGFAGFCNP